MTHAYIPVPVCPKCGERLPTVPDRRLRGDKIPRMVVGSLIAVIGAVGLLLDRIGAPTALTMMAFGLGTAFTHSFIAFLRAWRNGKK